MGSKPRISATIAAAGMLRARPPRSSKSLTTTPQVRRRGSAHFSGSGAVVPDKLDTLRNLIRSPDAGINPDQLFPETADYILHLKAQVIVLQKLVGLFGSQYHEDRDAA